MTDAGRSSEWAEFLDAVLRHPRLAERMLIIPGNHDLNIVDRANPARLDLPTSPNKRLRKLRVLSAMVAVQGERVRVVDRAGGRVGAPLRPRSSRISRKWQGSPTSASPFFPRRRRSWRRPTTRPRVSTSTR